MLAPLFSVLFVFAAYGLLFGLGVLGREADGDRVQISFQGCPEAKEALAHRVDTMGLGDPQWTDSPLAVTVTLPSDPLDAEDIPKTLVRPGVMEIYQDGDDTPTFTNAQITTAAPRLDLTMIPYTVMTLDAEAWAQAREAAGTEPKGRWRFDLDGETIGYQSNEVKIVGVYPASRPHHDG